MNTVSEQFRQFEAEGGGRSLSISCDLPGGFVFCADVDPIDPMSTPEKSTDWPIWRDYPKHITNVDGHINMDTYRPSVSGR